MNENIKKQQFISMRIEGKNFGEIAKILNISRLSLIDWNKQANIRNAINEGLSLLINDSVRALELGKQGRLLAIMKTYKKVNDEIETRDFKDVSSEKLIQLSIILNQKINDQNTRVEIGRDKIFESFGNGESFILDILE